MFCFSSNADVIGVLHQVVKTQVAGGERKACVNILLSDEMSIT